MKSIRFALTLLNRSADLPHMKPYRYALFLLLPLHTCLAQTTTSPKPNRRQELYDQYNSYSTKPVSAAAIPVSVKTDSIMEAQQSSVSNPVLPQTDAPDENQRQPSTAAGRSGVRIGFRGGVTYPAFTDTRPTSTPGPGFVGGITLTLGKGTVSFQPEVNYTRYTVKNNSVFGANRQAVDNVEVPLFLKIATGTYAGNRFFINIGPYARYTASTSIDGKKVDVSNTKGRFGFGAAAGIGVALKTGPGHLTIEGRGLYLVGGTDSGLPTDSNTILGQATLGYVLPLGSR
jgi:hypothetical protein